MNKFIENNKAEIYKVLKELCLIPAPSHHEEKRAEYCKNFLEKCGAKGVYIDNALNVVFPLNCEGSNEIMVYAAHTDTVFPDLTPLPYFDDGKKVHCPGASDDTANVVVLMFMAKYFLENNIVPEKGILFVCDSCEEGLGNLKGTRQIFEDYKGRVRGFIAFESTLSRLTTSCVGSHRYEVEVLTEGGHSYGKFGNDNAIAKLSEMVNKIYSMEVPKKENTKTTYNVGEISGGTSVNTIAQNAKMLCEYRSDDKECLEIMENKFKEIFKSAATEKIKVNVTKIGDRPCSNTEFSKIEPMIKIAQPIIEEVSGENAWFTNSSTDCNFPLSIGIPALCVGTCNGFGMHRRDEWVDKASILKGLELAIKLGEAFK